MVDKIDWDKMWSNFHNWLNDREDNGRCKACGSCSECYPEWEEQVEKIQELVDAQVREIVEKKI